MMSKVKTFVRASSGVFVVFCSDGCITYEDLKMCQKEKWVPILALRQGDIFTIPCFTDSKLAQQFGRRNLPPDWIGGIIALTRKETDWMLAKGWNLQVYTFPQLVKDRVGISYEVLELSCEPDLFVK